VNLSDCASEIRSGSTIRGERVALQGKILIYGRNPA